MRYCRRLSFYILCRLPFVSGSLLMLYSVLIHTSLLINYGVYPLIRYSDRVNNCFSVLWVVACYQARSNSRHIASARCYFCGPVDVQDSKHLMRLLAIALVFRFIVKTLICLQNSRAWIRERMGECVHSRVWAHIRARGRACPHLRACKFTLVPWETRRFSCEACKRYSGGKPSQELKFFFFHFSKWCR